MLSESARMASAHEARFRVAYPNSVPRSIKVVALDEPSRHLVDEVSRLPWNKASFFTSMSFEGDAARGRFLDQGLAQRHRRAYQGSDRRDRRGQFRHGGERRRGRPGASVIGEACLARNVTTIGLVVQSPETSEADLSRTLSHMRPFAKMLVIASGQDYVEVMLTALRA